MVGFSVEGAIAADLSLNEGNPPFQTEGDYVRNSLAPHLTTSPTDSLITQIGVIKLDATAARGFGRDGKKEQETCPCCEPFAPRFPS
jgi:hypothetical protein